MKKPAKTARQPVLEVYAGHRPVVNGSLAPIEPCWFWRLRAGNGEIVADGAESYTRRSNAVRAAKRVLALAAKPPKVVIVGPNGVIVA